MAGKKDSLRYALGRAKLTGAKKTIYNHKQEATRFIDALRALGSGVQTWTNVTNKHVGMVVDHWKKEGLAPSTIKNYLAGVRAVCAAYGNDRIHKENEAFGVERRTYVSNTDKSVSDETYARVLSDLRASPDPDHRRVAVMIELQRTLGLRLEESMKFNPYRDFKADLERSQVHIHAGTKGGRPRWETAWNDAQRQAIENARESGFYTSPKSTIIPKDQSEQSWRNRCYKITSAVGLSKKQSAGTFHGFRHAYAHARYAFLTGFDPPAKFASKDDFRANAREIAGNDWEWRDEEARCVIREEMGHSPDRDDIDGQYLGTK